MATNATVSLPLKAQTARQVSLICNHVTKCRNMYATAFFIALLFAAAVLRCVELHTCSTAVALHIFLDAHKQFIDKTNPFLQISM